MWYFTYFIVIPIFYFIWDSDSFYLIHSAVEFWNLIGQKILIRFL